MKDRQPCQSEAEARLSRWRLLLWPSTVLVYFARGVPQIRSTISGV